MESRVWSAVASRRFLLWGAASLLALVGAAMFVQAHALDCTTGTAPCPAAGEGPGWPQGKTTPYPPASGVPPFPGIPPGNIYGPVYTDIQNDPCWNAMDAAINPGNGHLGHIAQVQNLVASGGMQGFNAGSVDLWHTGVDTDPATAYEWSVNSEIMLGPDGYMRMELQEPLVMIDNALDGDPTTREGELKITDVHPNHAYCIYGALNYDGPYWFIDSTYGDGGGTNVVDKDLDYWYKNLFQMEYPDTTPLATWLLFIASSYDDPVQVFPPPLAVDAGGPYEVYKGSPAKVSAKVSGGLPPYKCKWSGAGGSWSFVNLCAPKGGGKPQVTFNVCGIKGVTVTVTDGQGSTASDTAEVHNYCHPTGSLIVSDFPRNCIDSTVDFNGPGATDPDGTSADANGKGLGTGLLSQTWTWTNVVDGSVIATFSGADPPRMLFPQPTPVKVEMVLIDGDKLPGKLTVTRQFTPLGDPGCPPILEAMGNIRLPLGASTSIDFDASDLNDPTGEGHVYNLEGLPGATFNTLTGELYYKADSVITVCGIKVRVTDTEYLWDQVEFCLTVYNPTIDSDGDGTFDGSDNCPSSVNNGQEDQDGDGIGDACDPSVDLPGTGTGGGGGGPGTSGTGGSGSGSGTGTGASGDIDGWAADLDADTVSDVNDNCVGKPNPDQSNLDNDAFGDECDDDRDGDLVLEVTSSEAAGALDNCPTIANGDQADEDGDGIGDACVHLVFGGADGAGGAGGSGTGAGGFSADGANAPSLDCGEDCPVRSRASDSSTLGDRLTRNTFVGVGFGVVTLVAVGGLLTIWAVRRWKA